MKTIKIITTKRPYWLTSVRSINNLLVLVESTTRVGAMRGALAIVEANISASKRG